MKSGVGILRRKSLMVSSLQGFLGGFGIDDQLEFRGDGNRPMFPPLMVGLVIAFTMIAIGVSSTLAAVAPHTDDVGKGHRIHNAALGDLNSKRPPEDGLLPADREFALAWAAAADARAAAEPLRALPTDKRHELATMAPAKPSDLTIGLRFTAPIYLAFFKLPAAPDPMPASSNRQPVWPGFAVALMMLMMTVVALTPRTHQASCREDC